MHRAKHPNQKIVLLVTDFPLLNEVENDLAWSGASHLSLLSDLAKVGISQRDIHTTYLSYQRQDKDSHDWSTELKKKKNLPKGCNYGQEAKEIVLSSAEGAVRTESIDTEWRDGTFEEETTYYGLEKLSTQEWWSIPHQKDLYYSADLREEVQGLLEEITKVQPKVIIVAGKWSYFFLVGNVTQAQTMNTGSSQKPMGGLAKHRASLEELHPSWGLPQTLVFPILPPITKQRSPDKIPVMKWDYAKVGDIYKELTEGSKELKDYLRPEREFILGTEYEVICNWFTELLSKLGKEEVLVSVDIETRWLASIDCIGFAYEASSGLCVPFSTLANPTYWSEDQEVGIYQLMTKVFKHPNCKVTGQNYNYDAAFIRKFWLIETNAEVDTMILHHVLYNSMQKDLAFLASVYCEGYKFWKDDQNGADEVRWQYNVKDILFTREIATVLQDVLSQQPKSLQDFYNFQQHDLAPALNRVMNRGLRVDLAKKEELHEKLSVILSQVEQNLSYLIGEQFNPKSTPQVREVFGDLLGIKPKLNRKTGAESFGSEAMLGYLEEYPLLRPIITLMLEYRSIGIFVRTFLAAKVDDDQRMRTSYNVAGTSTYRLASRKNPFGGGMNMQNIPKAGKIDLKFSLAKVEGEDSGEVEGVDASSEVIGITELPNCKQLFIPDEGYTFFDIDYSGADARIVAWDSNSKFLMDIFNDESQDLYSVIASEYYKRPISKKAKERQIFKAVCHATAYLGKAPTIAGAAGLLVKEVEQVQRFYFSAAPEVKEWHRRIINDIDTKGYVTNAFGARGYFLDRSDKNVYNKAVAFLPQSAIGIMVNKGLVNVDKKEDHRVVQVLLQTHDSLSGQFLTSDTGAASRIVKHMSVPLMFKKELIIPAGIVTSLTSYGDCN